MKRNVYVWSVRILMWLAAAITAALTLFLVGYVLCKGIPNLSWEFISTKPSAPTLPNGWSFPLQASIKTVSK